jgi:hypothetical protein
MKPASFQSAAVVCFKNDSQNVINDSHFKMCVVSAERNIINITGRQYSVG